MDLTKMLKWSGQNLSLIPLTGMCTVIQYYMLIFGFHISAIIFQNSTKIWNLQDGQSSHQTLTICYVPNTVHFP